LPQFSPSEEYWIDSHIHFRSITGRDCLNSLLDEWFANLDAYRLGRVVCISNQENMFKVFADTAQEDTRFAWMYWPKIDAPSLTKVRDAANHGSCAIKMHNSPVIEGRVPRNIYESKEWQDIFAFAADNDVPLVWHACSRVNASPYHGGTLHWLWETGWKNGVKFTNEDLLQDMLALMRRFPKLKIVGAHTLYLGIDRLEELFKEYENLYIDSSCSMILRWADDFSPEVRARLCDFIETWSERIIFGSDSSLFPGSIDEYAIQAFLGHARFMLKLWLNDKALQDVAWRTASRLFHLKPVIWSRRGSVRP
jgi:predicted TIM-barrel fold metal-dependent hydrolase